jgi:hypothetical protein
MGISPSSSSLGKNGSTLAGSTYQGLTPGWPRLSRAAKRR